MKGASPRIVLTRKHRCSVRLTPVDTRRARFWIRTAFSNRTTTRPSLHGTHLWKFGVRIREITDDNTSPREFQRNLYVQRRRRAGARREQSAGPGAGQPVPVAITSIEQYRRTLLFQNQGLPPVRSARWAAARRSSRSARAIRRINDGPVRHRRVRRATTGVALPNLTLSYGLRYEAQTNIGDHLDFAPRIGLAWAPGRQRANRQAEDGRAARLRRILRPLRMWQHADRRALQRHRAAAVRHCVAELFPEVPSARRWRHCRLFELVVIQPIAPDVHAPRLMQTAISLERQLPHGTTLAVTYTNAHCRT